MASGEDAPEREGLGLAAVVVVAVAAGRLAPAAAEALDVLFFSPTFSISG